MDEAKALIINAQWELFCNLWSIINYEKIVRNPFWGGFPPWLLNYPHMKIRSTQEDFISATTKWLTRLVKEFEDLQHTNSGPIIAVQIENEYGSGFKIRKFFEWPMCQTTTLLNPCVPISQIQHKIFFKRKF